MEHISGWLAVISVIIFPFIGWVFNTLITNKINELKTAQEEDRKLFFKRLDEEQAFCENNYVNQKLYDQAKQFHEKETDAKFNNLVESMNKQFENVEGKIDDIKDLINEKFNGKNKQGG